MRQQTLDKGVRYGQLRYRVGRKVIAAYNSMQIMAMPNVRLAMARFIGKRNMTRPTRKKNTEMCNRAGIASTREIILNWMIPSYRYARILARLWGAGWHSMACR